MKPDTENNPVKVAVDPGICGFHCTVTVTKKESKTATVQISGSQCGQVQKMAADLTELSLMDLFILPAKNRVFKAAGQAGCHPPCLVPSAVLKAAEVALGMALKKEAFIKFM